MPLFLIFHLLKLGEKVYSQIYAVKRHEFVIHLFGEEYLKHTNQLMIVDTN